MKNNAKYLVVTPFFPSEESFVGSYIFDQVSELKKQTKYNIDIIKVDSVYSTQKDYVYNGFNVFIFKLIDLPFFIFPGLLHFINRIRFNYFLIRKNIFDIEIAHAHVTYPAAYLISDLRCKKIVQHHGLDVLQLKNGRSCFFRKMQKKYLIRRSVKQLNKSDINVGVSRKVLNKLSSFRKYNPIKEVVLYNGVDRSKFYPIIKKKQDVFLIGCVANFWVLKDQMTLIKSVELLKEKEIDIVVRLIGSGKNLRECMDYVSTRNLTEIIKFEKEIKHERLNNFYNEIDLFVLPSYYEALGCVYLESWATNTPFIAVEGQGIEELVPDQFKDRLLISRSDEIDLSNKILSLYNQRLHLEFDERYDIKETISLFLKQDIFINR